jgi:ABC-type Fe3+ transport system substrate-binding protein
MKRIGSRAVGVAVSIAAVMSAGSLSAQESVLMYRGADRDQKVLEGARREGQVVLYTGLVINVALRPMAEAFMAKYPFVKMTYWRGESEAIATKVLAEQRANNVLADVIEGTGVGELALAANMIQPYHSPMREFLPKNLLDPENLTAPTRLSYFGMAYNTRLVPADKVPQTYEDLLDPMWKGKISWRIESSSGTPLFLTNLRLAWGEEKALDYFKKLSQQKVVNFGSGSARTLVDRVMAGEYALAVNVFAHFPVISAAQGAPVNTKLLNPVPSTASTIAIVKGAKHPYASLLLVDFMLGPDGQQVFSKAGLFPARPDVAPSPVVASVDPNVAKVPVNFILGSTIEKMEKRSDEIYQELFR